MLAKGKVLERYRRRYEYLHFEFTYNVGTFIKKSIEFFADNHAFPFTSRRGHEYFLPKGKVRVAY